MLNQLKKSALLAVVIGGSNLFCTGQEEALVIHLPFGIEFVAHDVKFVSQVTSESTIAGEKVEPTPVVEATPKEAEPVDKKDYTPVDLSDSLREFVADFNFDGEGHMTISSEGIKYLTSMLPVEITSMFSVEKKSKEELLLEPYLKSPHCVKLLSEAKELGDQIEKRDFGLKVHKNFLDSLLFKFIFNPSKEVQAKVDARFAVFYKDLTNDAFVSDIYQVEARFVARFVVFYKDLTNDAFVSDIYQVVAKIVVARALAIRDKILNDFQTGCAGCAG